MKKRKRIHDEDDERIYTVWRYPTNNMMSPRFFGWTKNKVLIKAFFEVRSKELYYYKVNTDEDIGTELDESVGTGDLELGIFSYQSSKSGKMMYLVSTEEERIKAENKILDMLSDLTSLAWSDNFMQAIHAFQALKPKYSEALQYIGYLPKEMRLTGDEITNGNPNNYRFDNDDLVMIAEFPAISMGMVYSFEAVIKALREDIV
jgi:hypothetical protein